jgi:predicted component of type VI protein secretion system
MPRVLGRLPYGPDTVPVRSFNYVEQVKVRTTKSICGPARRSPSHPIW